MDQAGDGSQEVRTREEQREGVELQQLQDGSEQLYCLCREPYGEGVCMLGCDGCGEWYHPECLGLPHTESPPATRACPVMRIACGTGCGPTAQARTMTAA